MGRSPNCSKSTRPFVEDLAEPDQLAAGERTADTDRLLGMKDPAQAQRAFRDLQLRQQVEKRFDS